ncbi:MAG: SDR family oxidoreductase [Promethearchaeota archaeon]
MRALLTGGSGTLGTELKKLSGDDIEFYSPSSTECNILNREQIEICFKKKHFDLVVHCAAATNVTEIEKSPLGALETNVIGTINLVRECMRHNKKIIFISTDYVFDGDRGNYSINEPINPLSKYAKTKASAELAVRTYDNSLVIRTSFYGHEFPYEKAFIDQWTSKDYVDVIAPKVLGAIRSDKMGIVHIGSPRRSVYEIALERREDVEPIRLSEINFKIPRDVSFKNE